MRVAIICDALEEQWPSMDLVGDMLFQCLKKGHPEFEVAQLRLPMTRRFCLTLDRVIYRFHTYPSWIRKQRNRFDVFHIVDHSYSHLVHELPADRTVVTCHDLDAFGCLVNREKVRRSAAFRLMSQRILGGMLKSGHIACVSKTVQSELLAAKLITAERTSVVRNGTHPSCSPRPHACADAEVLHKDYLLHVGSTIPRKRIDILLQIFAGIRKQYPNLQLVRIGGPFADSQEQLARELGVRECIHVMPHLDRDVLAAFYRRASLVLMPTEAEGFGLPLVEAMACGCPVVASDIPVLREIGGAAATFCPVADVPAWVHTIAQLLAEKTRDNQRWQERREHGIAHASQFTWDQYAMQCAEIYKTMINQTEAARRAA